MWSILVATPPACHLQQHPPSRSGDVTSMQVDSAPSRRPATQARGLLLILVLLVTACGGATSDASARSAPDSFSPLVKKVLPAVVNIAVTETVTGGDVLGELPRELQDTPLGREFRRRF